MNARARRRPRPTHPAQLALVWADPRRTLKAIERAEKRRGEDIPRDHAKPETRADALHVAHCCANHGCAYDSDDCPIEALRLRQRSACGAAAPCERVQAVRLPPRPLDTRPPCPPRDRRTQHLTGGATRKGHR